MSSLERTAVPPRHDSPVSNDVSATMSAQDVAYLDTRSDAFPAKREAPAPRGRASLARLHIDAELERAVVFEVVAAEGVDAFLPAGLPVDSMDSSAGGADQPGICR